MIAEFSICPLGTKHMSKDLARVDEVLRGSGLEYRLGPMGTCIEGDISAIRHCHEAVRSKHDRATTIVIDDREHEPHHLSDVGACVEEQVGAPAWPSGGVNQQQSGAKKLFGEILISKEQCHGAWKNVDPQGGHGQPARLAVRCRRADGKGKCGSDRHH